VDCDAIAAKVAGEQIAAKPAPAPAKKAVKKKAVRK
jgi:hypothetical protein